MINNILINNRQEVVDALPAIFEEIREVNAKWHVNPDGTPKPKDEDFEPRCILLMKSELFEAFEGVRKKNQPDDHLPQYPTESVEMVDLFIRGIDFVVFNDDPAGIVALQTGLHFTTGDQAIAGESTIMIYALIDTLLTNALNSDDPLVGVLSTIDVVIAYCDLNDIPLMEIYRAKTAYNRSRADHKPEARAAEGGKQF